MRCGWKTTWALVLGVLLPAWGMVPPFPLLASGGGVAEAASGQEFPGGEAREALEARLATVRDNLNRLDANEAGETSLAAAGVTEELLDRIFASEDQGALENFQAAMEPFETSYRFVLSARLQAERILMLLTGEESEDPLLTGVPPLGGDPAFDQAQARWLLDRVGALATEVRQELASGTGGKASDPALFRKLYRLKFAQAHQETLQKALEWGRTRPEGLVGGNAEALRTRESAVAERQRQLKDAVNALLAPTPEPTATPTPEPTATPTPEPTATPTPELTATPTPEPTATPTPEPTATPTPEPTATPTPEPTATPTPEPTATPTPEPTATPTPEPTATPTPEPTATPTPDPREGKALLLREEGMALEFQGKPAEALKKYEASLKFVEAPETRFLAEKLRAQRQEARKLRQEAIALQKAKKMEESREKYRKSHTLWPDPKLVSHLEWMDRDIAERAAREERSQRRAEARRLVNEAVALQKEKRYEEALEKLRESLALEQSPKVSAYVATLEKRRQEALAKREKALALRQEGWGLEQERRLQDALERYRKSLALAPDPRLEERVKALQERMKEGARLRSEGVKLQQEGRLAEALEQYRASLARVFDAKLEAHVQKLEAFLQQKGSPQQNP